MVIIDDDDSTDTKSPTSQLPPPVTAHRASEHSALVAGPPPPAYSYSPSTSSAASPLANSSYNSEYYNGPYRYPYDVPDASQPVRKHGEKASRRFIRAFFIGAIICAVLYSLLENLKVAVNKGKFGRMHLAAYQINILFSLIEETLLIFLTLHQDTNPSTPATPDEIDKPGRVPKRPDHPSDKIRMNEPTCIIGTPGSTESQEDNAYMIMNFSIPISADKLYFFNKGPLTYGSITFDTSPEPSSEIFVDVTVHDTTQPAIQQSKVCLFNTLGEWGVGIWTSEWSGPSPGNVLHYDLVIRFPSAKAKPDSPLILNSLRTKFDLFDHTFNDLSGVRFENLNVQTSNSPITTKSSLSADSALLHTSNADISGKFAVSASLELITQNKPINAKVDLRNTGENAPTKLVMRSNNAPLTVDLAMYSDTSSVIDSFGNSGGTFDVSAETTNAQLTLNSLAQPINSSLTLHASTSNSPAQILLHPNFAGDFSVQTTIYSVVIKIDESGESLQESQGGIESEEEMESELEYSGTKQFTRQARLLGWKPTHALGHAWWVDADGKDAGFAKGSAVVRTSLGPVFLQV